MALLHKQKSVVEKKIAAIKRQVEGEILRSTRHKSGAEQIAKKALRYSMLTNGHRWRPTLFLALMEAMRIPYQGYLRVAAGIEIIHTGTLIIDDLPFVDNATTRRGKPCCHVRFGVDATVYASHLAFDLAEALILQAATPELRQEIFTEIAVLKETLVSGQCLERAFYKGTLPATGRNLAKQYYLKSGALFGFTASLAGWLAGIKRENIHLLKHFGEEAGVAYQIADDIADVSGNSNLIGKQVNMDQGKANYVRCFGKQFAVKKLDHHHNESVSLLGKLFQRGILHKSKMLLLHITNEIHKHY